MVLISFFVCRLFDQGLGRELCGGCVLGSVAGSVGFILFELFVLAAVFEESLNFLVAAAERSSLCRMAFSVFC